AGRQGQLTNCDPPIRSLKRTTKTSIAPVNLVNPTAAALTPPPSSHPLPSVRLRARSASIRTTWGRCHVVVADRTDSCTVADRGVHGIRQHDAERFVRLDRRVAVHRNLWCVAPGAHCRREDGWFTLSEGLVAWLSAVGALTR